MKKECLNCNSTFQVREMPYPSLQKIEDKKRFCKSSCARHYGLKKSWHDERRANRVESIKRGMNRPGVRLRVALGQTGEKSNQWLGNDASYNSKHRWIQRHWKRTGKCEFCGITPPPRKNGRSGTEWSNVSGKYDRSDRKDWQELCSKCHKFYDKALRLKVKEQQ